MAIGDLGIPAPNAGSSGGGLTDAELRATPVPVSGTVTETNSGAIKTAVETIDNAISGTEMQVDVVAALPAGTNLIGKVSIDQVTANANEVVIKSITAGNTNIGDVDVASIAAGDNNIGNVDIASIAAGDNNIGNVDIVTAPSVGTTGSATPASATQIGGFDASGNLRAVRLVDTDSGAGTEYQLAINLRKIASGGSVEAGTSSDPLRVDPTGTTSQPVSQATASNLNCTEASASAIKTAVELIDDTVATLGTTTYTEATTKGLIIGAVRRDADTTLANTTNEVTPLQVDANGYLKVEAFSGQTLPVSIASAQIASGAIASGAVASGAVASGAIASGAIASGAIAAGAIAAGATSIAENEDVARAAADRLVKVAQVRMDTPVANANVSGTEDYTQFICDNFGKTWISGTVPEDTAHVAGEAIMQGGVRRIDTAATSAGSSGDWATMDASAEGALWATLTPTTTSGLSVANFNSGDTYTALTNSAQVIKASAGNLYGYYIYNPNASAVYIMIYNIAAASVTVGTSTALMVFAVPATSGSNMMFPYPITFSNAGWSIAAATTGGGNTAPATALEVMIWYK